MIIQKRRQLYSLIVHFLRTKHAGSLFGLVWHFIPLVAVSIVYLIFNVRGEAATGSPLQPLLCVSIVMLFHSMLVAASAALEKSHGMLLNNLLPAEIVVIADVLAAALPHAIVAGTISVVMLMIGDVSAGGLVLILYLLALLVVAGLGVAFPIAYFAFVIRDLQNLIGVLLLVLLLSSPITLDLSQIEGLRAAAVYLNPLSYWILPVRAACRTDGVVQVHHVALATLMALGSFSGGLWLFSSIKRHLGQYA